MSYPSSSDVAPGQPTAASHYNTLRADALRFGEDSADAVNMGELFSRYEHNLQMQYLATNRIRVPASTTAPVGIVVNGIPLRSVANVDLAVGDAPSGAAATYYVFAIASGDSTTFTIDINTSSAEGTDQRLIGSFYWNGSAILQDSIQTVYSAFLESMLPISRPHLVQGRLTFTSAVPVTSSDVTSAGTVYFTPYKGNKVSLYSAGRDAWLLHELSEISASLSGIASGKNVDIFLFDNAGTLTLNLVEWSNDSTRATALTTQDGVYVKSEAAGYLYLGTLRTNGAGSSEDSIANRLLWNYFNRVLRHLYRLEDTEHTYDVEANRKWNGGNDTDVCLVIGVAEDSLQLSLMVFMCVDTGDTAYAAISADGGVDDDLAWLYTEWTDYSRNAGSVTASYAAGYHYFYITEFGNETDDGGVFDEGEINIIFPM